MADSHNPLNVIHDAAKTLSNAARQYAALPIRRGASGDLTVLLITSKRTRRWIAPKGWPIPGLLPHETAAQEAFEEAGVKGIIAHRSVGSYKYEKIRRRRGPVICDVAVYPLLVLDERKNWPESRLRQRQWMAVDEAIAKTGHAGLAELLAAERHSLLDTIPQTASALRQPGSTR